MKGRMFCRGSGWRAGLRSAWRAGRWAAVGLGFPVLWACNSRDLQSPDSPPEQVTEHYFEQTVNNNVDIVFMVDNSDSMDPKQDNLRKNFPAFMNVLKALPAGLPDVHIGVVTSSLGAGTSSDVPGCPPGGDRGVFQNAPRDTGGSGFHVLCNSVPKDRYIISLAKGTKNNFDGDIADVFSCIANVGTGGCGFEHQLAAPARALGANLGGWTGGAPMENSGFLRKDAFLALILLTDEDDCSAPIDSDLFDTKQNSVSDPYGALASYRCNEFGHLCGGVPPPHASPAMNLQDCHSAEDAGKLIKVADFVNFFKTVKRNTNNVLVSAITGPAEPYTVSLNGNGEPQIDHSCWQNGWGADPSVRIKEFIDAFGMNGTNFSICKADYSPALDRIAHEIGKRLGAQCIDGVLKDADADPSNGVQASCSVVDQIPRDDGSTVEAPIPACDSPSRGSGACWKLVANTKDCTVSGFELVIDRGGAMAASGTVTAVKCATCIDGMDPPAPGCMSSSG